MEIAAILLLIVTIISIVILMVVVMPKFKQLFDDMGAEIPAVTKIFLSASEFLQNYGFFIIVMLIGTLKNHGQISIKMDRIIIKLPWIGELIKKVQLARYAKTLSMMLKFGVPIQKSLEISKCVITNSWIRSELSDSSKRLNEGATFSSTIGRHFPVLTQQMVKIGEEAGDLGNSLSSISTIAQQEVNRSIHRLISIFEPLIIVTLGMIVAAVIGSIMVAVLSMNDLISI